MQEKIKVNKLDQRLFGFINTPHFSIYFWCLFIGLRDSCLIVGEPESGMKGLGSRAGQVIVMCSWTRHFILTVPLSNQEYKQVPANSQVSLMNCQEVTLMNRHPIQEGAGNQYKLRLMGHMAHKNRLHHTIPSLPYDSNLFIIASLLSY